MAARLVPPAPGPLRVPRGRSPVPPSPARRTQMVRRARRSCSCGCAAAASRGSAIADDRRGRAVDPQEGSGWCRGAAREIVVAVEHDRSSWPMRCKNSAWPRARCGAKSARAVARSPGHATVSRPALSASRSGLSRRQRRGQLMAGAAQVDSLRQIDGPPGHRVERGIARRHAAHCRAGGAVAGFARVLASPFGPAPQASPSLTQNEPGLSESSCCIACVCGLMEAKPDRCCAAVGPRRRCRAAASTNPANAASTMSARTAAQHTQRSALHVTRKLTSSRCVKPLSPSHSKLSCRCRRQGC